MPKCSEMYIFSIFLQNNDSGSVTHLMQNVHTILREKSRKLYSKENMKFSISILIHQIKYSRVQEIENIFCTLEYGLTTH